MAGNKGEQSEKLIGRLPAEYRIFVPGYRAGADKLRQRWPVAQSTIPSGG